jgi:hypothetical protein
MNWQKLVLTLQNLCTCTDIQHQGLADLTLASVSAKIAATYRELEVRSPYSKGKLLSPTEYYNRTEIKVITGAHVGPDKVQGQPIRSILRFGYLLFLIAVESKIVSLSPLFISKC